MQKHPAEPDRSPVHEYEFARYRNRAFLLERLMHAKGLAPAVFRGLHAVGEAAHPIVQQRPVDETRPDIQNVDQFPIEPLETPGLVGVYDEIGVCFEQAVIEIHHTADEFRREDADASIVQEIDAGRPPARVEDGVIAEMGIAVNHAEAAEWPPPSGE